MTVEQIMDSSAINGDMFISPYFYVSLILCLAIYWALSTFIIIPIIKELASVKYEEIIKLICLVLGISFCVYLAIGDYSHNHKEKLLTSAEFTNKQVPLKVITLDNHKYDIYLENGEQIQNNHAVIKISDDETSIVKYVELNEELAKDFDKYPRVEIIISKKDVSKILN